MASSPQAADGPRFATILSARANNARPSELEVLLRGHCHKIRVTEKLSGGAHLVFPSESSLAVRAYYPPDLKALRIKNPEEGSDSDDEGDDADGLAAFAAQFRYAAVLVVLPDDDENNGIATVESVSPILDRMQRLLEHADATSDGPTTRLLVVRTTEQAVDALTAVADALRPSVTSLKTQFVKRQEREVDPFHTTGPRLAEWLLMQNDVGPNDADALLSSASNLGSLVGRDVNGVIGDPRLKHLLRGLFELTQESPDAASVTPSSIAPDASPPLARADSGDPTVAYMNWRHPQVMTPLHSYASVAHHPPSAPTFLSTTYDDGMYYHPSYVPPPPSSYAPPPSYVVRAPPSSGVMTRPVSRAVLGPPTVDSHRGGGGRYAGVVVDPSVGPFADESRIRPPRSAAHGAPVPPAGAAFHPRGGFVGTMATPRRGYPFRR